MHSINVQLNLYKATPFQKIKNLIQSLAKNTESKVFKVFLWNILFEINLTISYPQVIAQIEKEIKVALEEIPKDDIDIIKIDLPPINANKREKVLETIHNIFQAERIDDELFIKVSVIIVL